MPNDVFISYRRKDLEFVSQLHQELTNRGISAWFDQEDIAQLKKITNGTKINVIGDEVFENMVFDNKKHYSVLSNEQLAERSIVISSLGITFNVPGWKIGYCVASEKLR